MGSQKRSRPDVKVNTPLRKGSETQGGETSTQLGNDGSQNNNPISLESAQKRAKTNDQDTLSIKSRSTFTGGTWPRLRKASPSTQIARESILADKSRNTASTVDLSRFEPRKEDTSNTVEVSDPNTSQNHQNPILSNDFLKEQESLSQEGDRKKLDVVCPPGDSVQPITDASGRPATASSWLDWFGGSGIIQKDLSELSPPPTLKRDAGAEPRKPFDAVASVPLGDQANPEAQQDASNSETNIGDEPKISKGSWLRVWASSTIGSSSMSDAHLQNNNSEHSMHSPEIPIQPNSIAPAAGATWAFWSNDSWKSIERGGNQQDSGQIAITGGPSQDNPAPALVTTTTGDDKVETGRGVSRGRQPLRDSNEVSIQSARIEAPQKPSAQSPSITLSDSLKKAPLQQSPAPSNGVPANILLPSFEGTYSLAENPSIIQKITRLLLLNQQNTTKQIHLVREPTKIKKALAIGIHGLFPAALFRTVIGQPTGTSIRFANHAAAAIHRWASSHENDCEVEKVALEGEGKIADRVDNLWNLLLNWIDHVRNADFILVACHSQGVPVAMMLVAKLIEFRVVTSARIGICAMAGVSMGPFADYKSRLLSGSAAELFDFGNPNSEVSKRYENSLRVALQYGVRISFIGSIDDQLVSLESAVFSPISHPYIYRAVFVDGRVHAPDFISHLVGFALKLRNLGISDHGLIRELSVPLAGSLYTGGGHSRLYDETRIYDVSVSFALETTSINDIPPRVENFDISTSPNPFQLPWSMRGLLEEDIVKNELGQETAELLKQFHEWKPTTKVLKDVKYRLEAVKSKL